MQVLGFVHGHREAKVIQIAEALHLGPVAVRHHLDRLRADGLVDVRVERHGVGRPALIYFATEEAEELSGRTYLKVISRLLRHLEKTETDEAGSGVRHESLTRVSTGIAAEIAADHEAEIRGSTLEERVAEVSRALEREGIVDRWSKEGDVYKIVNDECPYLPLAGMNHAACNWDRECIELLVGAPVEQVRRIVDGAPICEYTIRLEPGFPVENARSHVEERA